MSYFAESAWNYLHRKIRKDNKRVLVVFPCLPEKKMLVLANTIKTACSEQKISLTLKIAYVVYSSWSEDGKNEAQRQKWLHEDEGDLTYWRNYIIQKDQSNLVVLCGVDPDTSVDIGSLFDFHRCDLKILWKEEMKESFRSWIEKKWAESQDDIIDIPIRTLEDINKTRPKNLDNLEVLDQLLKPLIELGKANLLDIDDWLLELDISKKNTTSEIFDLILISLDVFHLPKFTSFRSGKTKHKSFTFYVKKAISFFSYLMFFNKKTNKIENFVRKPDKSDKESQGLGTYPNSEALLQGLQKYIQTEDSGERENLKKCDFVFLYDDWLVFSKKETEPKKEQEKKQIVCDPIEEILHAVWQTFHQFNLTRKTRMNEEITRIEIIYKDEHSKKKTKASKNSAQKKADTNKSIAQARLQLLHILGGIDNIIQERLLLPDRQGKSIPITCRLVHHTMDWLENVPSDPLKLKFYVHIFIGQENVYKKLFVLSFPRTQAYGIADSLLDLTKNALESSPSSCILPVFHMLHYEDLLSTTNDEKLRQMMVYSFMNKDCVTLTNMLEQERIHSDALSNTLKNLSDKYKVFISAAYTEGLHSALFSDKWTQVQKAYIDCCQSVLDNPSSKSLPIASMLLRAFLVIKKRDLKLDTSWVTQPFEQSGIATVLHPAVLEMVKERILFLFSCFTSAYMHEIQQSDTSAKFTEDIWNRYVELASIRSPLVGLLSDKDQNVDITVHGKNLIHCIGSPEKKDTIFSKQPLMSDTTILRQNQESRFLVELLTDYFNIHPHARDGLSLAVFRNQDIQPVMIAVHTFLENLASMGWWHHSISSSAWYKPYDINITVFSESQDDIGITRWNEEWKKNLDAEEKEDVVHVYRLCRFSLAHRIVEKGKLMAESFSADIMILYNFIDAGENHHILMDIIPCDMTNNTPKFPILEESFHMVQNVGNYSKCYRIIGNEDFSLRSWHLKIMKYLQNHGILSDQKAILLKVGDFSPWCKTIDTLHDKAEWVVCVDSSMEKRFIYSTDPTGTIEMIKFGSGVGLHGDANYTISTRQFDQDKMKCFLEKSMQKMYSWTHKDCQSVATCVWNEAKKIPGLSLFYATREKSYLEHFMACSLTRKMLQAKGDVLCDCMIPLDAYKHWFTLDKGKCYPDIMWFIASLTHDNRITLKMQLIGCKMVLKSEKLDKFLTQTQMQIKKSLQVLVPCFTPYKQSSDAYRMNVLPDQRYWWFQLHRLISNNIEINASQYLPVYAAMERLSKGDYDISWEASMITFLDVASDLSLFPDAVSDVDLFPDAASDLSLFPDAVSDVDLFPDAVFSKPEILQLAIHDVLFSVTVSKFNTNTSETNTYTKDITMSSDNASHENCMVVDPANRKAQCVSEIPPKFRGKK